MDAFVLFFIDDLLTPHAQTRKMMYVHCMDLPINWMLFLFRARHDNEQQGIDNEKTIMKTGTRRSVSVMMSPTLISRAAALHVSTPQIITDDSTPCEGYPGGGGNLSLIDCPAITVPAVNQRQA